MPQTNPTELVAPSVEMVALKPCPFCGGEASAEGHTRYSRPLPDTEWADGTPITECFSVNCISCGAVSRSGIVSGYQTKSEAIERWNTRAALSVILPEGWVAVPRVPTEAMLDQGVAVLDAPDDVYVSPSRVWAAMIAGAPQNIRNSDLLPEGLHPTETLPEDDPPVLSEAWCEMMADREGAEEKRHAVDGYVDAFYEVASLLGIGARSASPKEIWEIEMRPALQRLLAGASTPNLDSYIVGREDADEFRAGIAELTLKGVANYYRCGFRAARYFFDSSIALSEATPEEDEHVRSFIAEVSQELGGAGPLPAAPIAATSGKEGGRDG